MVTMTLKEIRAQFAPGQVWEAENTYNPNANGQRTLSEMKTTQFVWKTAHVPRYWMDFPKKSQITEAGEGLLVFRLFETGDNAHHTLTLRRTQQ
jgi:hypothetical protein